MKETREYWQSVRGICILAVVLIHSLGGFYYLGIQVSCGWKLKCNGYAVAGILVLSCAEAVGLWAAGLYIGFYTVGSFFYSVTMIGWFLKKIKNGHGNYNLLTKIGDCS